MQEVILIMMIMYPDELLKNLKVEMKHKTRKRNHTFELIHSDLERRKAIIQDHHQHHHPPRHHHHHQPEKKHSYDLGKREETGQKWEHELAEPVVE